MKYTFYELLNASPPAVHAAFGKPWCDPMPTRTALCAFTDEHGSRVLVGSVTSFYLSRRCKRISRARALKLCPHLAHALDDEEPAQ